MALGADVDWYDYKHLFAFYCSEQHKGYNSCNSRESDPVVHVFVVVVAVVVVVERHCS